MDAELIQHRLLYPAVYAEPIQYPLQHITTYGEFIHDRLRHTAIPAESVLKGQIRHGGSSAHAAAKASTPVIYHSPFTIHHFFKKSSFTPVHVDVGPIVMSYNQCHTAVLLIAESYNSGHTAVLLIAEQHNLCHSHVEPVAGCRNPVHIQSTTLWSREWLMVNGEW
ncbi:MAG: hypothetical protein H6664_12885 [Ardenticatenaceae bacterium]|nr:hypothetical protein [Ardenticatenaceae bacterium]